MNSMENWMTAYLLNALWQIPLLLAGAWLAARLAARISPRTEHRIWVCALLAQIALPACPLTVFQLWSMLRSLLSWSGAADAGQIHVIITPVAAIASRSLHLPPLVIAALLTACAAGICYSAVRLVWGLGKTLSILRDSQPVRLESDMADCWSRAREDFAVRFRNPGFAPCIAASDGIAGPVTAGSHTLLLPDGFLAGLPEAEFSALLAHEFAHMARRDFAKNLAYGIVSLPIAWHPAAWLTRAYLAESRERICDAMAAEAVSGRERYARSLLRLASIMANAAPAGALHALGIFDSNNLERRIMNLTAKHSQIRGLRRLAVLAACVALGAAACTSALALRMEVNQPTKPANVPLHVKITKLTIVYRVPPVYPPQAKKDHIAGTVILDARIGKDGSTEAIKVVKSVRDDLDQSAIDAVRQWKYQPYLLNGEPIEVETTINIIYSLGK